MCPCELILSHSLLSVSVSDSLLQFVPLLPGGHEFHEKDSSGRRSFQRTGGRSGLPGEAHYCLCATVPRGPHHRPHRGACAHQVQSFLNLMVSRERLPKCLISQIKVAYSDEVVYFTLAATFFKAHWRVTNITWGLNVALTAVNLCPRPCLPCL